jgi:hypothetical protein
MTRIPRCLLVLVLTATLALVSVPIAGARTLETSQTADRTESVWFEAALSWLENVAGLHFPIPGRHHRATKSQDSDPKGGRLPVGGACIDPQGGCGG